MSLTCISCKLLFSVPELHQEHYKGDWHRYNLKRRLAELPPLTREEFEERAAAFNATAEEKAPKQSSRCESCNKTFSSKNAKVNHLKSKKHLQVEAGDIGKGKKVSDLPPPAIKEKATLDKEVASDEEWSDDGSGWESCDENEDNGKITIDTNDCLFCEHQSDSTEKNVSHMTDAHSFFIPDIEYLTDLDSLIAGLAVKVHLDHVCLWCNGKGRGFRCAKSVKQHMIDKGHCKMLHEGEALLEYVDFYDYSSSEVPKDTVDEEVIEELLGNAEYEFVLPSGATIGHRSLAIYYKQNLKPTAPDSRHKVKKILQHYKALGYTGTTGQAAVKRVRDVMYMQRIKSRYNLKLGMKNNKFQPHFRRQVMF